MIEQVVKRDGTLEKYNFDKIINAVALAYNSCKEELTPDIINKLREYVEGKISNLVEVDIEVIQDNVISFLSNENPEIASHYKKVREQRERARNKRNKILRDMKEKLEAKHIENQNANVDEMSFGGRKGEAMDVATKSLALDEYMSEKSRKNHIENRDYIHDLNAYVDGEHNCLSIPYDKTLRKGFKTKQTDVRPANSVGTSLQLVAVIAQLQSLQQFGGVSATHLDWTMVPYVRKSFFRHYKDGCKYINNIDSIDSLFNDNMSIDNENWKTYNPAAYHYAVDMSKREIHQAVEGLYHNLNTLQSRSGNQLPFTSINYGTCTLTEGRLVTDEILNVSIEGLGEHHKTPIFPCGIFQYMKGVNDKPGTPNYDLKRKALYSTATRFYPNYANNDWSNNNAWIEYDRNVKNEIINSLSKEEYSKLIERCEEDPETADILYLMVNDDNIVINPIVRPIEYFSTMGCRTVNGADVNFKKLYNRNIHSFIETGKLVCDDLISAIQKDGRGNICPVTIILPTLAMETKESDKTGNLPEAFLKVLEKNMDEAKDMLIERFEWICSQPAESARFMYENGTMAGYIPEEGIRSALEHGTLTIGQLGLAECLQILVGCDHTKKEGMELAKKIEDLYKRKCAEYKEKYQLNFGVYYTPAENLCYTAMTKFKNKYGVIPNVSDHDYFTNSMHVPVWDEIDPFEKINIEAELTGYSSAGCITYVELPASAKHNIDAMETIVDYAMEKDIPYFACNPTIDQCLDCGYEDEINDVCPICGSKNIFRPRRVTGYLSTDYHNFNYGKQREVEDRVKHIKN